MEEEDSQASPSSSGGSKRFKTITSWQNKSDNSKAAPSLFLNLLHSPIKTPSPSPSPQEKGASPQQQAFTRDGDSQQDSQQSQQGIKRKKIAVHPGSLEEVIATKEKQKRQQTTTSPSSSQMQQESPAKKPKRMPLIFEIVGNQSQSQPSLVSPPATQPNPTPPQKHQSLTPPKTKIASPHKSAASPEIKENQQEEKRELTLEEWIAQKKKELGWDTTTTNVQKEDDSPPKEKKKKRKDQQEERDEEEQEQEEDVIFQVKIKKRKGIDKEAKKGKEKTKATREISSPLLLDEDDEGRENEDISLSPKKRRTEISLLDDNQSEEEEEGEADRDYNSSSSLSSPMFPSSASSIPSSMIFEDTTPSVPATATTTPQSIVGGQLTPCSGIPSAFVAASSPDETPETQFRFRPPSTTPPTPSPVTPAVPTPPPSSSSPSSSASSYPSTQPSSAVSLKGESPSSQLISLSSAPTAPSSATTTTTTTTTTTIPESPSPSPSPTTPSLKHNPVKMTKPFKFPEVKKRRPFLPSRIIKEDEEEKEKQSMDIEEEEKDEDFLKEGSEIQEREEEKEEEEEEETGLSLSKSASEKSVKKESPQPQRREKMTPLRLGGMGGEDETPTRGVIISSKSPPKGKGNTITSPPKKEPTTSPIGGLQKSPPGSKGPTTPIHPFFTQHAAQKAVPEGFVDTTTSLEQFQSFREELRKSDTTAWGVTYRYDSTNFRRSELLGKKSEEFPSLHEQVLGIGFLPAKAKKPFFIPLTHQEITHFFDSKEERKETSPIGIKLKRQAMKEFLASPNAKICYDTQQCLKVAFCMFPNRLGALETRNLLDPKIAAWVLDTSMPSYHYDDLLSHFLNVDNRAVNLGSFVQSSPNKKRFFMDLLNCLRLMTNLRIKLEKDDMLDVFIEQEMEITPILSKMEFRGIAFDLDSLTQHQRLVQKRMEELEQEAARIVGHPVSLSSPKQLAHVLYQELGLPVQDDKGPSKKKTAQHSTSENVLLKLKDKHPLPGIILEHRHCVKLIGTYIQSLASKAISRPEQVYSSVHSSWQHTGTATGRVSSSEPNLQALPRTAISLLRSSESEGPDDSVSINVRDAFVSRPGYTLVKADYSQMEMRILAQVSGDEYLLQFFSEGKDIHTLISAHMFGKKPEEVTPTERDQAKAVVYGILYGMGPRSLSNILNVSRNEAKEFILKFLEKFPQIAEFIDSVVERAHEEGYIKTLFNRRRLLPKIKEISDDNKAERQAVNSIIQGTASDVVKMAMIGIENDIRKQEQLEAQQRKEEKIRRKEEKEKEEREKEEKEKQEEQRRKEEKDKEQEIQTLIEIEEEGKLKLHVRDEIEELLEIEERMMEEEQRKENEKEKGKEKEKDIKEEKEDSDDLDEQQKKEKGKYCAALVLQIHDELVYEVRDDMISWIEDIMLNNMEGIQIPITSYGSAAVEEIKQEKKEKKEEKGKEKEKEEKEEEEKKEKEEKTIVFPVRLFLGDRFGSMRNFPLKPKNQEARYQARAKALEENKQQEEGMILID